jgi:flavin reductase (DIM6/NTAB) family NADH-FMN oxidoreductase RutF
VVGRLSADTDPSADTIADRFDELMAAYDTAMLIVTTVTRAGHRSGCLVGFATQCSIDPPRFLVCLSIRNHTFRAAGDADVLAVHLVPPDRDDLAERFGGTTGDEVDTFAGVDWRPGPGGVTHLGEVVDMEPGHEP